jgi:hypothetical protein
MSYDIYYHGRVVGHFDHFIVSPRMDAMKWAEGEGLQINDQELMKKLRRTQRLLSERPTEPGEELGNNLPRAAVLRRAFDWLLSGFSPTRRRMRGRVIDYLCRQADFAHLYDIRKALGFPGSTAGFLPGNPVDVAIRWLVKSSKIKCEETLYAPCFAMSDCKSILPDFFGYLPVVLRDNATAVLSTDFLGMAFDYEIPIFRVNAPKDPRFCRSCGVDIDVRHKPGRCPLCGSESESQIKAVVAREST